MRVISRKRLLNFSQDHPEAATAIDRWYRLTMKADWKSINEVRAMFPTADAAGEFTVFNICGNSYRLLTIIRYIQHQVLIKPLLTHPEYDEWCKQQRSRK